MLLLQEAPSRCPVGPTPARLSHFLSVISWKGHTSCRPLQALFLQPAESRAKHLQSSIVFGRRHLQSLCLTSSSL